MEIVSPAGNIEKLYYAWSYGADAAYIGLKSFSLRIKADNFYEDEYKKVIALKKQFPEKKLFCALNISFHNRDIDNFISEIDYFKQYPIDSFIISDMGAIRLIQKHFPHAHLHLSTQANCINREAVKVYSDLGFSRIVLGREASLDDIRQIKDVNPKMELEVFAHGAMCIAYSGRCLLSAYMTGRSANSGFCSHSCRWDYKVLEEKERPGEYFPVYEGDDFTAILSSKDICMIDHLDDMKKAGVDSLKIEGRMKSLYYAALVTRSYRKAIDALDGKITNEEAAPYIDELYKTNHREFATGFFYSQADANKTTRGETKSEWELAGTIGTPLTLSESHALFEKAQSQKNVFEKELSEMHPDAKKARLKDLEMNPEKNPKPFQKRAGYALFRFKALNKIDQAEYIEYISPNIILLGDEDYQFVDAETGNLLPWVTFNNDCLIYTNKKIAEGFIVRKKNERKNT